MLSYSVYIQYTVYDYIIYTLLHNVSRTKGCKFFDFLLGMIFYNAYICKYMSIWYDYWCMITLSSAVA